MRNRPQRAVFLLPTSTPWSTSLSRRGSTLEKAGGAKFWGQSLRHAGLVGNACDGR